VRIDRELLRISQSRFLGFGEGTALEVEQLVELFGCRSMPRSLRGV
jgi:hypothetical protein